ncbi:hypothetical protein J4558_11845 [Leptolyngbya sp. 15MV]|nr:hypothetical protein J4558_11845 [Leptolyngbya sp. 15MV]
MRELAPAAEPRSPAHPDQAASAAPPSERPSGYEVGYGKPPRHTRFKPGQSGNPRGRPRGAKSLNTLVRGTLTQKVAVRTAAGESRMTRIEAVLHKTVEQAMKGNPRALAELIKLYASAVPEEKGPTDPDQRAEDLTATDLAILEDYARELGQQQAGGAP